MSPAESSHVVVVRGGLAAARSCEQLRAQGYAGTITLVTSGPHLPYDRPPLSKDVLTAGVDSTTLAVDYAGLGVEVRTGLRATALRFSRLILVALGDCGRLGLPSGDHR